MTKKSNSKPMTQILERLCKFDYIDVVIFPEEVILEEPVENWPLCDCLISFHSKGEVNLSNGVNHGFIIQNTKKRISQWIPVPLVRLLVLLVGWKTLLDYRIGLLTVS